MNKEMNILTVILCCSLILIIFTGSYKYDQEAIVKSLEKYQEHHKIYHDAYNGFVKVNIISVKVESESTKISLRSDDIKDIHGIYYVKFDTYFKYIKLYEDYSVITVSTNIPPEEALSWIDNRLEDAPKGEYEINNKTITFTTVQEKPHGDTVEVIYKGTTKNGKLYLSSYSKSTKNRRVLVYDYFKEKQ
ncbi:hypothetical protein GC105_16605 [Alkalibaculum sp. M08DMB]|uniref:Uncharacterized protein n=1 Tax=Alkalibaculum sporogenes TaxID=2655001 RepID=A0A6A7KDG6_9FIRM|nr:hypothetical protein [Alkalibaculum sporogenes]MPW27376.1 hypothetical protein [Alkalibaculum sporogenes]